MQQTLSSPAVSAVSLQTEGPGSCSDKEGDTPLILAARNRSSLDVSCVRALISGAKRKGVPVGAAIRNKARRSSCTIASALVSHPQLPLCAPTPPV